MSDFCVVCQNMMYLRVKEERLLEKYCRLCNFSVTMPPGQSVLVSETQFARSTDPSPWLTPDLRHDPTLPHLDNIECPACKQTGDVTYARHDDQGMLYTYMCIKCGAFWTRGK